MVMNLTGQQHYAGEVKKGAETGRGFCADLYFASVEACEKLEKMRLRFIGVFKAVQLPSNINIPSDRAFRQHNSPFFHPWHFVGT